MRTVFSKMHYIGMFSLLIVTLLITSCDTQRRPTGVEPPVAEERPVELTLHGDTRIDNYYWLNDREDPEVIAYIEAENEYLNTMMAHTERLQDRLYNEMRGRVKEDDQSVPYKLDDYYYYIRYEEGGEYPIYCRRYESMDAEEEIIVNANELAEGHTFFMLSGLTMSPDHRLAAFGVDTVGRRFYTIMFKDLGTGEMSDTQIPNVTGNLVWRTTTEPSFIPGRTRKRFGRIRYTVTNLVSRSVRLAWSSRKGTRRSICGLRKPNPVSTSL
jgi:oligopeptidase B